MFDYLGVLDFDDFTGASGDLAVRSFDRQNGSFSRPVRKVNGMAGWPYKNHDFSEGRVIRFLAHPHYINMLFVLLILIFPYFSQIFGTFFP